MAASNTAAKAARSTHRRHSNGFRIGKLLYSPCFEQLQLQRPTGNRFLITASELNERIIALLAGRAAENRVFGDVSTGAADDLEKATDVARECVTRFGMSNVGQAVSKPQRLQWLNDAATGFRPRDYFEATAARVDEAIRKTIANAFDETKKMLGARIAEPHAGAGLLLHHETITPKHFPPLQRETRAGGEEGQPTWALPIEAAHG